MPPAQQGQFKADSVSSHKSFYLFLAISNNYLTKALVSQKLQVEGRMQEKERMQKETKKAQVQEEKRATMAAAQTKMVDAVRGLDGKNKIWADAMEKRLSGDYYPGIISETEGKFSSVMYHIGHVMRESEPILAGIIRGNKSCKGFEVTSGLSSLEVRGERFSAAITATPSKDPLHAFEMHYAVERSGKKIEDSREPLSEANMMWRVAFDLGQKLLDYRRWPFISI